MGEKGSLTLILFGFLYSWLTSKLKVFWKCFETLLNKGKTEKTSLLFHNISPKKVTCKSSNPCTFKPRFRVLDPFFFLAHVQPNSGGAIGVRFPTITVGYYATLH